MEEMYQVFIDSIANLGKLSFGSENYLAKMEKAFEKIVQSFCKQYNMKVDLKKEKTETMLKVGFMYATSGEIHYSTEYIADYKKKLVELTNSAKPGQYNPQYDDSSYAVFLLNALRHEFQHCIQYSQQENLEVSEQAYLNAVSMGIHDISGRIIRKF